MGSATPGTSRGHAARGRASASCVLLPQPHGFEGRFPAGESSRIGEPCRRVRRHRACGRLDRDATPVTTGEGSTEGQHRGAEIAELVDLDPEISPGRVDVGQERPEAITAAIDVALGPSATARAHLDVGEANAVEMSLWSRKDDYPRPAAVRAPPPKPVPPRGKRRREPPMAVARSKSERERVPPKSGPRSLRPHSVVLPGVSVRSLVVRRGPGRRPRSGSQGSTATTTPAC